MRELLPQKLIELAEKCPDPLYVIGGAVRDRLAKLSSAECDLDISSPMDAESFSHLAEEVGLHVNAVYKNTGTVKLSDGEKNDYEFTSFRSDKYVRGIHVPVETFFTKDILLDAKRRDFTVNAIYYDIAKDKYVDPLGGIPDVADKKLRTVDRAEKVFGEDGLRLMRLARQAAQLGFYPDEECLAGAKANAMLISDISPERIFKELNTILLADNRYGNPMGHYQGLKLLDETRVLDYILPELTLGRNMAQRSDFHDHDVLEHSLRTVLYADKSVRLAALLHDVGKPFCQIRDGHVHDHPEEGGRIAAEILMRLKAPKAVTEETAELTRLHMYDGNGKTKIPKLRRFFVAHAPILEKLIALRQADFSACKDDLSQSPSNLRWIEELAKMKAEGAPLTLKQLAVSGGEVALVDGMEARYISAVLRELLCHAAVFPEENTKNRLLKLVPAYLKRVKKVNL